MNASKLLLIAAVAAAASVGAYADEADGSQNVLQIQGQKSRSEVQADLQQYRQAGVNPWATSYDQLSGFQSQRTRADVRAEAIASRDEAAALTGEDSGSAYLAQTGTRGVASSTVLASRPSAVKAE